MTDTDTILNLEQMIKAHLGDITKLRAQLKTHRDMHKQTFTQDKDFSEIDEKHKEVKRKAQEIKQKLSKTDAVVGVQMTIKNLQEELKDASSALSSYLNQYVRLTQNTEIIGPDGDTHQIVQTTKLVKRKNP